MIQRSLLIRWLIATWAGWLVGVLLIIVFALVGELFNVGGSQSFVGAGMGMGVGLAQSRVIRFIIQKSGLWILSSFIGLTLPFLFTDIAAAIGRGPAFSLVACVAVGGLVAGIWQASILAPHFRRSWIWVFASALGWTLAAGGGWAADPVARSFRGLIGALVYLALAAGGGLLLGLVTGLTLNFMKPKAQA